MRMYMTLISDETQKCRSLSCKSLLASSRNSLHISPHMTACADQLHSAVPGVASGCDRGLLGCSRSRLYEVAVGAGHFVAGNNRKRREHHSSNYPHETTKDQ